MSKVMHNPGIVMKNLNYVVRENETLVWAIFTNFIGMNKHVMNNHFWL